MTAIRTHALFRKVDHPQNNTYHGGCLVYGGRGAGVDTGIMVDYEGFVFISEQALKEMCEVFGFSFNEDGVRVEQENAHLSAENFRLLAENAEMNEQLTAIGIAISHAAGK